MPPVNDDLANATLIDTDGLTALAGTTVGSTVEAGDETTEGYVDTVWYRIEPSGTSDVIIAIKNANYAYYAELYVFPGGGTPTDFADLINGYANYVDALEDGGGTGDTEINVPIPDPTDTYYLLVTNYDFIEDIEGTFSLEIFIPATFICDAAPGANLSSPTVSIVDTDWVRDEQFRVIVPDVNYTGNMEYTKTFEIECPTCMAPGDYKIELFRRYTTSVGEINDIAHVQMRKNGKPLTQAYGGYWTTNDSAEWLAITHLDWADSVNTVHDGAGPHYVKLISGDVLSFDIGSWTDNDDRIMEVQRVKLSQVIPIPPLASWRKALNGAESWDDSSATTISPFREQDGIIYGFMDVFAESTTSGTPPSVYLGIWTWEISDSDITPLSGDTPIGFGGSMDCLTSTAPRSSLGTDTEVSARDFCILPNGDIIAAWIEHQDPTGFFSRVYKVCVSQYDASGDSWTSLTTDLWDHGEQNRHAPYISVDNFGGDDVYIAWSEARQTGIGVGVGFWWRCKHLDVSSSTFTEIGTSSSAGITHFPGAPATETEAGSFDNHLRLRVSPAGVPWVAWPEWDADNPFDNQYPLAYYYDGSAWVDSEVPFPSLVPPSIGPNDYSAALDSTNYISFAVYGLYYMDLTFCQNDGPNEDPTICFQYVYNSDEVGFDTSGWAVFQYDGSPGAWSNELFLVEGVDFGNNPEKGQQFGQVGYALGGGNPYFETCGGWTQGFSLLNDGNVPWILSQKGWGSSSPDHPYAVKMRTDGSGFDLLCNGFPDDETFPYQTFNGATGGGWMDPTTNAGILVNGTPVIIYRDSDSWVGGIVLVAALPCGGWVDLTRIKFRGFQLGDA